MTLVPLTHACMAVVAAHFGLPLDILEGLRAAEGGLVGAVTPNRDRNSQITSVDIGPFQINDAVWLDRMTTAWQQPNRKATFELLRGNGCTNALAAGAIFRGYLDQDGGNYGLAIGHYNSHRLSKAEAYRRHFIKALLSLRQGAIALPRYGKIARR